MLTLLLLLLLASADFWFAFREASLTAVRCNQVLKTFNVYYSSDECKLYRINTRQPSIGGVHSNASAARSESGTFGTIGLRSREGVVRSDAFRTWVEE